MKNLRKISADMVFTISGPPQRDKVVVVDEETGKIKDIADRKDFDSAELEIHKGILTPGFVNSHCHLELSFMKGKIKKGTGLLKFVKTVIEIRDNFSEDEQMEAIANAEKEMMDNGIAAVGDISNDTRSFAQKEQGNLRYHTFVEIFDLGPENTMKAFDTGKKVFRQVPFAADSTASITPHAPYSCTPELYWLADKFTAKYGGMLSIHNQETIADDQLFNKKAGDWVKFYKDMNLSLDWLEKTGRNSPESTLETLSFGNKLILVHNTNTSADDLAWVQKNVKDVYWCFCPNANLYIEDKLPDFSLFTEGKIKPVIGTDSLASNDKLSVLEELKTISKAAPSIPLETLMEWATINGAKALDFDKTHGTLQKGKAPGVNLISGVNVDTMKLAASSKVKKLV